MARPSCALYIYIRLIWCTQEPFDGSRYKHRCVSHGTTLYVLGGESEMIPHGFLRSVLSIDLAPLHQDPSAVHWEHRTPMHRCRGSFGCAVHGGQLFVAGGEGAHLDTLEDDVEDQLEDDGLRHVEVRSACTVCGGGFSCGGGCLLACL